MTIIRVQYRRPLATRPAFGKWQVYSAAYFDATSTTLTSDQKDKIQRLFLGFSATSSASWAASTVFDYIGANARISTWQFNTGALIHLADSSVTVPSSDFGTSTTVTYPSQCQVAVGYRSAPGAHPQFGRSRFYIGPLKMAASSVQSAPGRGAYLASGTVDGIATNAKSCIDALAASGLVLQVRHRTYSAPNVIVPGGDFFSAAQELYVDDRFDVMRSRAGWVTHQKRLTL